MKLYILLITVGLVLASGCTIQLPGQAKLEGFQLGVEAAFSDCLTTMYVQSGSGGPWGAEITQCASRNEKAAKYDEMMARAPVGSTAVVCMALNSNISNVSMVN